MSMFVTYTGEVQNRAGRPIDQEIQEIRDAIQESAKTDIFKAIPGSSKDDLTYWRQRLYRQAENINLKVKIRLTAEGEVAFLGYNPDAPEKPPVEEVKEEAVIPAPAPAKARGRRTSARK